MKARHHVATFLLIAASHAELKTNVKFEHRISDQSDPIEAWHNEVNNVGDDYEEVDDDCEHSVDDDVDGQDGSKTLGFDVENDDNDNVDDETIYYIHEESL